MDIPICFNDEPNTEEGELPPMGPFDDNGYRPEYEYPGYDVDANAGYELTHKQPEYFISSSSNSFPDSSTSNAASRPFANRTTTFRLIALKSSVLSRSKRVVVLDGHAEVSIGRDKSNSARIRLPEMLVSKYHAAIYWDGGRKEWSIVDMGSLYGTFVVSDRDSRQATVPVSVPSNDIGTQPDNVDQRSAGHTTADSSSEKPSRGVRLSEPRKASMPKVLRHMDRITIGGTTFMVHEHLDRRPCLECTIEAHGEIPLFNDSAKAAAVYGLLSTNNAVENTSVARKRKLEEGRDARKAIAKLKTNLLSQRSYSAPSQSSISISSISMNDYKDRSALRRQLNPEPRMPPPPPPPALLPGSTIPFVPPATTELGWIPSSHAPEPTTTPAAPISSSNIGHKLLMMQGWSPGTALGESPDIALKEPLELARNISRAGLGSRATSSSTSSGDKQDWKEEGKRRRWGDVEGRNE
ncbi:hypothetical protein M422DRAFT_243255 [Sphaerobolus stellatus SS14]|nr:hypothetical protein M422DRAFT_243255 [Sphaerobolus stellatus SS14]